MITTRLELFDAGKVWGLWSATQEELRGHVRKVKGGESGKRRESVERVHLFSFC